MAICVLSAAYKHERVIGVFVDSEHFGAGSEEIFFADLSSRLLKDWLVKFPDFLEAVSFSHNFAHYELAERIKTLEYSFSCVLSLVGIVKLLEFLKSKLHCFAMMDREATEQHFEILSRRFLSSDRSDVQLSFLKDLLLSPL